MNRDIEFDSMTITAFIEKKIGKALPEAEKVDIKDSISLGDAIAFQQLIDSVFREVNKEYKKLLDDLTEAGLLLTDKIERYRRFTESPLGPGAKKRLDSPRKGPTGEPKSAALFRDSHPKRAPEKNPFDDL